MLSFDGKISYSEWCRHNKQEAFTCCSCESRSFRDIWRLATRFITLSTLFSGQGTHQVSDVLDEYESCLNQISLPGCRPSLETPKGNKGGSCLIQKIVCVYRSIKTLPRLCDSSSHFVRSVHSAEVLSILSKSACVCTNGTMHARSNCIRGHLDIWEHVSSLVDHSDNQFRTYTSADNPSRNTHPLQKQKAKKSIHAPLLRSANDWTWPLYALAHPVRFELPGIGRKTTATA